MATDSRFKGPEHSGKSAWGWVIGILAAIAVVWIIAAVWNDRGVETPTTGELPTMDPDLGAAQDRATGMFEGDTQVEPDDTTGAAEPVGDVVVITEEDDLVGDPAGFLGQTVMIEGSVNEVLSDRLLRLDIDGTPGGDEILVLVESGHTLAAGDPARVQGVVEMMALADLESRVGTDVGEQVFDDMQSAVVIVADSATSR